MLSYVIRYITKSSWNISARVGSSCRRTSQASRWRLMTASGLWTTITSCSRCRHDSAGRFYVQPGSAGLTRWNARSAAVCGYLVVTADVHAVMSAVHRHAHAADPASVARSTRWHFHARVHVAAVPIHMAAWSSMRLVCVPTSYGLCCSLDLTRMVRLGVMRVCHHQRNVAASTATIYLCQFHFHLYQHSRHRQHLLCCQSVQPVYQYQQQTGSRHRGFILTRQRGYQIRRQWL